MTCNILEKMKKTIEALERLNNISKKPVVSQEILDDRKEDIVVLEDYFENLNKTIDALNNSKREDFDKILRNVVNLHYAYLDGNDIFESVHKIIVEFIKNYEEFNE